MPQTPRSRSLIAALAISVAGLAGIKGYEGYSERAYIPVPGDVPTIGYGTTEGVRLGDTITPPEAERRLRQDVSKFEGGIKRCVHVALYQQEYDAYTSLAYNIGVTAFCGSTLVRKLNAQDYAGACAEISKWNKFKGKPLAGLTKRRTQERTLCESAGLP